MNRIINAIESTEKLIKAKKLAPAKLASVNRSLDMNLKEYCAFQDQKSRAHLHGKLSHEEAQTVYSLLGSGPSEFNNQSLAIKVTLTKLFHELLTQVIKDHGTPNT